MARMRLDLQLLHFICSAMPIKSVAEIMYRVQVLDPEPSGPVNLCSKVSLKAGSKDRKSLYCNVV